MKLFDLIKKKLFKKQPVKTGDHLVDFYNRIDEDSRLLSKHGQIEFLTTVKYIEKYLKDGMKIIEIGAATGRYSHYFAQKGFEVDAVELIEHNIEIFKTKTLPDEEVTIRQGNAINLAEYPDGNYDVTLLLGPMYHLYTVEEQKKALSEAIRITKPDGYIFVAYCMVDPSVLTGIFKNNKVQQSIDDGLIDTETFETFFPPHGVFKLYTKDEIFELTEKLNAQRLHFLATDGYTLHMRNVIDKMDNETYELYLKYHFKTCERQDLVGTSHHTLDVLRKEEASMNSKQTEYVKNTPVIETERLILRPITPNDADMAFVWLSDEKVNKFMPYNLYKNTDEVLHWINVILPDSDKYHWGFMLKEDNLLIGSGSIGPDKGNHDEWGFGYNIRSDYWNKGFATEAAKRMIEFANKEHGIKDFVASHAVDNPASGRVMEKCGLTFERYTEYSTFDGKENFKAKSYKLHLE